MVRDAETGEMLALGDLWDIGFAVGLMMRPKSALGDGIAGTLTAVDRAHLLDGYAHGAAEANAIRAARPPAPVPVCDDEIPF